MNNDPPLLHVLGGFLIFVGLMALLVMVFWRVFFTRRQKSVVEPKPRIELPSRKAPATPSSPTPIESEVPTGTPWSAESADGFSSPAFGLKVRIEWSEESGLRQPKSYILSSPVAGLERIETTNEGSGQLSPDGRFLMIVNDDDIWLLDIEKNRALHLKPYMPKTYFSKALCRGTTAAFDVSYYDHKASWVDSIQLTEQGELLPPHKWNVPIQCE